MLFYSRNIFRRAQKKEIEPQEILLDKLAKKQQAFLGTSEKKLETPLPQKTLHYLLLVALAAISILFFQTFRLQILQGSFFEAAALENRYFVNFLTAARGVVYDSEMRQLVFNKSTFDLVYDKNFLPLQTQEKEKFFIKLSSLLQKESNELQKLIEENLSPQVILRENLDYNSLIFFKAMLDEFPGLDIVSRTTREYSQGPVFAHILGYTGRITAEEFRQKAESYNITDYIGREGLEKIYEGFLRKNIGKLQLERDAFGNILSKKVIELPRPGNSLKLWLNAKLQEKLYERLQRGILAVGAKRGAAVALNPKTGGILALVSLPSFDNNLFTQEQDLAKITLLLEDKEKALFNRVVSGQYLTGSTIKPLIAAAALQEKIVKPEDEINCQGFIEVPHQYEPDIIYRYHDWTAHGYTNMRKAIAQSCNVYFYLLGGGLEVANKEGLGVERIKHYLQLFGWGEKTGIDLPAEAEGLLPDPDWKKTTLGEAWTIGNTYHLSIGQGYLRVTPLQVATAFAAIANGGKLYQPRLVKEILDENKNPIEEIEPELIRENFIDRPNLEVVKEGMRDAVIYGSATKLNGLPVKVAAKTGTAETARENYYHHWVTVFAPYDDPEIVLTVLIEDVKGLQSATLPVVYDVLDWYFGPSVQDNQDNSLSATTSFPLNASERVGE